MFSIAAASPGSKDNIIKTAKKSYQREVRLAGLYLKHVPESLFEFPIPTTLYVLDLSNNLLEDIPGEFGTLVNLRILYLNGNKLKTLPESFGLHSYLRYVDLSRNQLTIVAQSINALKRLEWINLSGNCLTEVPHYLLSLPNLKKVFCLRNPSLKNIPREVAREGLQCMRDYLGIKVEAWDPLPWEECNCKCSPSLLEEIKSHVKNKQHSRSLPEVKGNSEFDFIEKCRYCGRSGGGTRESPSGHAATQTEISLCHGIKWNPQAIREPPNSDLKDYISSKRELDSSPNIISTSGIGPEDDVIGRLSKLYREQLDLVSQERTRVLISQVVRKFDSMSVGGRQERVMAKCMSCGLNRCPQSSEYGSMTDSDHPDHSNVGGTYDSDNDSCCGISGNVSDLDLLSDDDSWDSETGLSSQREGFGDADMDAPSWTSDLVTVQYITASKELVLVKDGAKITIPEFNLSGHKHSDFSIQFLEGISYLPDVTENSVIASPVVQTLPHGAKFFSASPAIVSIPLYVSLDLGDEVKCLVSDTGPNEPVCWQEVDSKMVSVVGDSVLVRTVHFSLFCAVATKCHPHFEKEIIAEEGGLVQDDQYIKGVSVYFPPGSVEKNIKASVELLNHDKDYVPHIQDRQGKAMASPIISLGPSGMLFKEAVEVTLPLPNAHKVFENYGSVGLTIMYSSSSHGQTPHWRVLNTAYSLGRQEDGGYTVTFRTYHFSFYTFLWNILDSALPDDMKLYASSLIPHFSFWMFFQALMTECHHTRQFGICVLCCRSGHPMQGLSQYPIEIGECKPRKIKSGEVEIRLKSGIFSADLNAGEAETGLIKSEHFTGREFDKQFACLFNDDIPEYGLLGQVEIRCKDDDGSSRELFSFNMVKSAKRKVVKTGREPSEWESKLFRDLAEMLSVDDHLWQEFALALGYNRFEIREKFGAAEDRMQEILIDYKTCRNGDPEEFSQALIKVARTFKLVPVDQMMENRQNRRAEHAQGESSTQRGRPARYCRCPPTPPKSPQASKRKFEGAATDEPLTDAKLDDIALNISKSWKPVGRKLMLSDVELREIELNYQNAGEKEKAFQMLTTWRERDPDSCSMETLCEALYQAGQRYTANKCMGS